MHVCACVPQCVYVRAYMCTEHYVHVWYVCVYMHVICAHMVCACVSDGVCCVCMWYLVCVRAYVVCLCVCACESMYSVYVWCVHV